MNDAEIRTVIAGVLRGIAPEVDVNAVDPDDNFREAVDIDSFDFLNLLVGLHDKLGIEIPESDYGKLRSLNDLTKYLAGKVEAGANR